MSSDNQNNPYPTQTYQEQQNKFVEYFGEPLRPHVMHANARQTFDRYDLPEAYKGQNLYLAERIESLILDNDDLLWTSKLLPLTQTDQLSIQFDSWDFSESMAGRVPHEGISRIIRSTKHQHSGRMERRGLAFELEHGFLKTAEGRRHYMLNIQQIARAVQVTMNFDVLASLLTCKRYDIEWEHQHGYFTHRLPEIVQREVNMFGIVQKDINGFDIVLEQSKKMLSRYSVTPDALVLPSELQLYIPMVPEEKILFSNRGNLGVKQFEAGPIREYRKIKIYEAKNFALNENEAPVNLMASNEQIGQYNIMALDSNTNVSTHKSSHRNIMIYDADVDNFVEVEFLDALKHSMRFSEDREGPSDSHYELTHMHEDGDGALTDPFIFYDKKDPRKPWKVAEVFGQMHKDAETDFLSVDLMRNVVDSAVSGVSETEQEVFKQLYQSVLGKTGSPEFIAGSSLDGIDLKKKVKGNRKFVVDSTAAFYMNMGEQEKSVFRTLVSKLRKVFPESNFLNVDAGTKAKPSRWVKDFAFDKVVESTPSDWVYSFIYLVLFTSYKEKIEVVLSKTADKINNEGRRVISTKEDIETVIQTVGKGLGKSKAIDAKAFPAALSKYAVEHRLYRQMVLGVSALLVKHKDNLEDKMFTTTYHMLKKISGDSVKDAALLKRMGFDDLIAKDAGVDVEEIAAPMTRVIHEGCPSFVGSPFHRGLAEKADEIVEETVRKVGSTFSRANKMVRKVVGIEAGFDGEDLEEEGLSEIPASIYDGGNFGDRFRVVMDYDNVLARAMGLAFISSPMGQRTIEHMHANNVIIPFDIVLARPFMEFEMNHGLLTKAGRNTGATYVGHSDFQLADNVQSKMHYGNYTFYAKSLVTNHKNVLLLKNLFINRYRGGFNTEFWTKNAGIDFDKSDDIFARRDRPSIFAMVIPCGAQNRKKIMGQDPVDLRSKMPYYAHTLRFNGLEEPIYDEEVFTPGSQANTNSVVFQGMQYSYDQGSRRFSKITLGSGHLGQNIYPGVRAVYDGAMKHMKKVNYEQLF